MSERVIFQYRHADSLLHTMDARFKLLALILLCISTFAGGLISLMGLTILSMLLLFACRVRAKRLVRDLKPLLFLVVIVILARSITGTRPLLLDLGWLHLSRGGLAEGLFTGWRLLLVALFSSLLISTTRISHIRSAVAGITKPVPFLSETRIATMFGLTLGFIPLILFEAGEISAAQKARCVEVRRNPVYRIYALTVTLLRKVFQRGDNLVNAMEARCYSDRAVLPSLEIRGTDWIKLGFVVLVGALTLIYRV